MKLVKEELLPSQRQLVELFADKIVNMNMHQIQKFFDGYRGKKKVPQIAPLTISEEWTELQKEFKDQMPQEGTKFLKQEEIMKQISKWYQSQMPGFGLGAAPASTKTEAKVEAAEKKEEKVVQKEAYDIELISFDTAKKIVLIKEVRAMTNLGLKEAKELVEKAPCVVLKGVKRTECDAILKKLYENGAVARLKG